MSQGDDGGGEAEHLDAVPAAAAAGRARCAVASARRRPRRARPVPARTPAHTSQPERGTTRARRQRRPPQPRGSRRRSRAPAAEQLGRPSRSPGVQPDVLMQNGSPDATSGAREVSLPGSVAGRDRASTPSRDRTGLRLAGPSGHRVAGDPATAETPIAHTAGAGPPARGLGRGCRRARRQGVRVPGLPTAGPVARVGGPGGRRAAFADQPYWGRPGPGFGGPRGRCARRGPRAGCQRHEPDRADLHRGPAGTG